MMDYVEIPVLFHSKESKSLCELDISVELSDMDEIVIPFFRIDTIIPFIQGKEVYSQILIANNVYYSRRSVDEILDIIDEKNAEIFIPNEN